MHFTFSLFGARIIPIYTAGARLHALHTHSHTNFSVQANERHKPADQQTWVVMHSRVAAHRAHSLQLLFIFGRRFDSVFDDEDEEVFSIFGRTRHTFCVYSRHCPMTMLSSNAIQSFNVHATAYLMNRHLSPSIVDSVGASFTQRNCLIRSYFAFKRPMVNSYNAIECHKILFFFARVI